METEQWKERRSNRKGPKAFVSKEKVERFAFADYLLCKGKLSRSCLSRPGVHNLQKLFSGEKKKNQNPKGLACIYEHFGTSGF